MTHVFTNQPSSLALGTILIIEDDDLMRGFLRSALEAAGYEVREASNGRVGITLYRNMPPDLVITDILMPEMNGLDMILDLTRQFLNAKVIAISGEDGVANVLGTAKLLGARQIIRKPFSIQRLLHAVQYELTH